jgi:sulfate adenylyltransferase
MDVFNNPHGGKLKNLYLSSEETIQEKIKAKNYKSWNLTPRQLCDLELLLNGAFSPLEGFLNKDDYNAVVKTMRLSNDVLWPIPITLDVSEYFAADLKPGQYIALYDLEGVLIATLQISDIWIPNKKTEAKIVFGTIDEAHPSVNYLNNISYPIYIGGNLLGIQAPTHYDFNHLRDTPVELRERFRRLGWRKIIAFQTRNPMHRAHQELTLRALKHIEANLLIHPIVGITKSSDIDHFTRVRCYEHIMKRYPAQTSMLSLLPLAMRMGGPREALWHAIIRKNYGCTHLIIGRDHAGPGKDSKGEDFYGSYDAQNLLKKYQEELSITMIPFPVMVYAENRAKYVSIDETTDDDHILNISGTELRRRLQKGLDIPDWFSFADIVKELRKTHPPPHLQGFTIFFTGLSGSGKSTIANALTTKLMEIGGRNISLLDGDIIRKNLSNDLGFSKEHRDFNILRMGFVSSEIMKHGGIAICAPIAPYADTRRMVREMINQYGNFIEIHVATPLKVCEKRDRKGLYAKARAGIIKDFTGVSDPYEVPKSPEIVLDTTNISPDLAVRQVLVKLESMGFIR